MRKFSRISFVFVVLLSAFCGYARTWYVNASAAGPGDGSYANPYLNIWEAVNAAAEGDSIRVAAGTYNGQLRMKNRLKIYGGVGGPESVIIQGSGGRRPVVIDAVTGVLFKYVTMIGSDYIGGAVSMVSSTASFESCRFINCWTYSRILSDEHGGAIHAVLSTPRIIDCTFTSNRAGEEGNGGAVYLDRCAGYISTSNFQSNSAVHGMGGAIYMHESTTRIAECSFTSGRATYGGGVYIDHSYIDIEDCVFQANRAIIDDVWPAEVASGGGLAAGGLECGPVVRSCHFVENYASDRGGGAFTGGTTTQLIDCVFERNSTSFFGFGGGLHTAYLLPAPDPAPVQKVTNCTFNANSAPNGGAIYNDGPELQVVNCTLYGNTVYFSIPDPLPADITGGIFNNSGTAGILILNTIVRGNEGVAQIMNGPLGSTTVRYSDVEGGFAGVGNIDRDPIFRNAAAGDFHLTNNLFTATYSPCIDIGSPATDPDYALLPSHDFEGDRRVRDGDNTSGSIVDMGIDEANPRFLIFEASIDGSSSITGTPGTIVIATYRCSVSLDDIAPGVSGYKCSYTAKNAEISAMTMKGTDAGTLIDKGLAKGTASIVQGGAVTTLTMTNGPLKLEPGKPFATAIITINVKIPEKPGEVVLSLAGDGTSSAVFENGITLPFETFDKIISVGPGITLAQ